MIFLAVTPDPVLVTPGWVGFAVTAGVAIVTCLLLWDFNRRVRNLKFRAEAQEAIRKEQEEAAATEDTDAVDTDVVDSDAVEPDAQS